MSNKLETLHNLVIKHKLFENAIIFNGTDDPYFDMPRLNAIYQNELKHRKEKKIKEINIQIEIAEEEHNERLIEDLISQRRTIRNLIPAQIASIEDAKFPFELEIDLTKFIFI